MRKRMAAALGIALTGASLLFGGGAATAAAELQANIASYRPTIIEVGLRPIAFVVTVEVAPTTDEPDGAKTVTLRARPQAPGSTVVRDFRLTKFEKDKVQVWTFAGTLRPTDPAGEWSFTATATGFNGTTNTTTGGFRDFTIFHASRIVHFKVHPKAAHKGDQVYFSGRVQHAVDGRWRDGSAGEQLGIIDTAERGLAVVTTTGHGRFSGRFMADKSVDIVAFLKSNRSGAFNGSGQSRVVHVKVTEPAV